MCVCICMCMCVSILHTFITIIVDIAETWLLLTLNTAIFKHVNFSNSV